VRSEFRPSSAADASAIAALCERVLAVPAGSPMFSAAHMHWKYWRASADWQGSRSYVLERGAQIIAHGAVLPLSFVRDGKQLTLLHLFDWASEPSAIGSGVVLLKRIAALADGLLIVGGSDVTRRLVRPLGFRPFGDVMRHARIGGAGLLVPDPVESIGSVGIEASVSLAPDDDVVTRADEALGRELLDASPGQDWLQFRRSPSALRELASCPAARFQTYCVLRNGAQLGGFVLAFVPFQTRIAACWSEDGTAEAARAVLASACRQAQTEAATDELVCMANVPAEEQALRALGFQACGPVPMFVLAAREVIPDATHIRFQMLDGDVAFLHHAQPQPWL
jgi:hypothetical protein